MARWVASLILMVFIGPLRSLEIATTIEKLSGGVLRDAAEQLEDLHPRDVEERLVEGAGPVRRPALLGGTEEPVLVDPDQGADADLLGLLEPGDGRGEVAGREPAPRQFDLPGGTLDEVDAIAAR